MKLNHISYSWSRLPVGRSMVFTPFISHRRNVTSFYSIYILTEETVQTRVRVPPATSPISAKVSVHCWAVLHRVYLSVGNH